MFQPKPHPIFLPHALLRGRAMKAMSIIEHNGIPVDLDSIQLVKRHWHGIEERLIAELNDNFKIYDGVHFRVELFKRFLAQNGIPWPRDEKGALLLNGDTFKYMATKYPLIEEVRELRKTLSKLRLSSLPIGPDGRNRSYLAPFAHRPARNQPSNSEYIFGTAKWCRRFIKPTEGHGLIYFDWGQQEFAIAAYLSGDQNMIDAYRFGDPYLAFAIQAKAAPPHATKDSHSSVRKLFKECVLAVQYGMGEKTLAERINQTPAQARDLLRLHREIYRVFWKWSDGVSHFANAYGYLRTTFGWTVHIGSHVNPRFIRNFLMQSNGAEMLRLACCFAVEAGVKVCATVHDAILIEAPIDQLECARELTLAAMSDASCAVLDGHRIKADENSVLYPNHYLEKDKDEFKTAEKMWSRIWGIVNDLEGARVGPPVLVMSSASSEVTA